MSVSITDEELTPKANAQSLPPMTQRPLIAPKLGVPPPYPQGCPTQDPPSTLEPGLAWDRSHPPTVISYLEGPHFSYDHPSIFNASTLSTPWPYNDLLSPSRANIYRQIKYIRSLVDDSKGHDSGRHFVLSRATMVALELNFAPGPSRCLAFDALEIPVTRSVNHIADPGGRRLLSLRILLVDAVTEMFVQEGKSDQEKEEDYTTIPSLVDFQAEHNINDLREGKAIVRFTLPCCFLDSTHRTGHYRIYVALKLNGQHVGFQALPGIFEVVHMNNNLPEFGLQHVQDTTREDSLDQLPHNYRCKAINNGRHCHTDYLRVINGCFARTYSLAIGLGINPIPLRNMSAPGYHQQPRSFSPAERQRLNNAIELEYDYIERIITRAHRDTSMLRREYEIVTSLMRPAPIGSLPVELLRLIFSFTPDEHFDTLVQVCRRWREVVFSIWTPLKLASWTSINQVKPTLVRGYGLLSIIIDPSSDATDRPPDSPETERCAALMLAASASISRWRTLDILSLPDAKNANRFVGEQNDTTRVVPMNHLRSLSIPIRHDSSPFLDLLLPSIGATTSVQLTEMHLCSAQAMLYLAQPHCAPIFNHLTYFKCLLPRVDDVIDILPHFWKIEILVVSGFRFPTYTADVELPLTKTLRRVSLRGTSLGWMHHRKFLQLESCTIISPPALDPIPVTNLPLCTELSFEGLRFDTIHGFLIPTIHNLTLRSPQWSKSRGNDQISHLLRPEWGRNVFCPIYLRLHLTCSNEQLLRALYFMPKLKELILELDRPTALGSRFFLALTLLSRSSQDISSVEQAGKGDVLLPSLEVLGLKYRRWFRPGEPNEMPALVAMVHLDARDQRVKVWVEKCTNDQQRIQINHPPIPTSTLCSLGLFGCPIGDLSSNQVAQEVTHASMETFNPTCVEFHDADTLTFLSPSVYSCLFRQLHDFTLHVDVDQRVLSGALSHFEQLENVHMKKFSPPRPLPHLLLLRTLKKMQLDTTSLLWMEGCTFTKLESMEIGHIETKSSAQFQCVWMPVCKYASFPQTVSSELLKGFEIPRPLNLHLHHQSSDPMGGFNYPSTQHFKLHTASLHFIGSGGLQNALAVHPELETLEIKGLVFPHLLPQGLPELLDILMEPYAMSSHDRGDQIMGSPKQETPLCPRLKKLKLELTWTPDLKLKLSQEIEEVQNLMHQKQQDLEQERQVEHLKKEWEHWQVLGIDLEKVKKWEWQMLQAWERERACRTWGHGRMRDRVREWVRDRVRGRMWERIRERIRERKHRLERTLTLVPVRVRALGVEPEWGQNRREELEMELERLRLRLRELELTLKFVGGEDQTAPEIRLCRKYMKWRMENGCPMTCCQLAMGALRLEITNDSIGDIFAALESYDL